MPPFTAQARESSSDSAQESREQTPLRVAAYEAYDKDLAGKSCKKSEQNENMPCEQLQDFMDQSLKTDIYGCGNTGSSDQSNSRRQPNGDDATFNTGDTGRNYNRSINDNQNGNCDRDDSENSDRRNTGDNTDGRRDSGDDTDERGDSTGRYSRDHCHSPRDTHSPDDSTDPGDDSNGCPSDRVIIEPGKDLPRPQLAPNEFVVVVINISADALSRSGDFFNRVINGDANGSAGRGGSSGGGRGYDSGSNYDNSDSGRGSSGGGFSVPRLGDLLGSLPGLGSFFGGGNDRDDRGSDSQSGGSFFPSIGDVTGLDFFGDSNDDQNNNNSDNDDADGGLLSGLPGFGSLFGGNRGGRNGGRGQGGGGGIGGLIDGLPKPPGFVDPRDLPGFIDPTELVNQLPKPPGFVSPSELLNGLPKPPGFVDPSELVRGLPKPPDPFEIAKSLPKPPSPSKVIESLKNPVKFLSGLF
ncbi:MAG: hypothetical protein SGJ27_10425 [Candidatus Melainabacteria bacterium]|mgnify:CR=1 FL=1|nr:hypothetical protein [Candidatus Melainabacteria bacterium]